MVVDPIDIRRAQIQRRLDARFPDGMWLQVWDEFPGAKSKDLVRSCPAGRIYVGDAFLSSGTGPDLFELVFCCRWSARNTMADNPKDSYWACYWNEQMHQVRRYGQKADLIVPVDVPSGKEYGTTVLLFHPSDGLPGIREVPDISKEVCWTFEHLFFPEGLESYV